MTTQAQTVPAIQPGTAPALRSAIRLALLFAAIKFALQVGLTIYTTHIGYGYFRDELYYILCGRFLDWGYVDHGPLVALQARLALLLFGKSLVGIRTFTAIAGAAKVFLTGIIAWRLGGSRAAQTLAMIGVLCAPCYIGLDGFLSMNSFEPVFWMTSLLSILCITLETNPTLTPRWWLLFGISSGLGLLNKPDMAFFLTSLALALLLTPERQILWSRWCTLGIALTLAIAFPNLVWQANHHWATWEFLRSGQAIGKNLPAAPPAFLLQQTMTLGPATLFLWGAGLIWLLFSKRAPGFRQIGFRWIGLTWIILLAIMIPLHAKDYYTVPIYPALFAAGGVAWAGTSTKLPWRIPVYATILILTTAIILPMASPILPPAPWLRYTQALHLTSKPQEKYAVGPLPQFYADRFGWQELANKVAAIYDSLPAEERTRTGIMASNYGEASAINFLGHDSAGHPLPFCISGHNNYYLWGPHGYTGEEIIVINGATLDQMHEYYTSVRKVGDLDHPYAMPFERDHTIWLCRGRKGNLLAGWDELKHFE